MLESIITSKTRIKLLLKFFLNYQNMCHLRGLESEFGDSSNSIRLELINLEKAGLLNSTVKGNKKLYYANTNYPFFSEINSILKKFVGIDLIIEQLLSQIKELEAAYLTHDLAVGTDSKIVELALIGTKLNREDINMQIEKAETLISRKIGYVILTREDFLGTYKNSPVLLIWETKPHLDKLGSKPLSI